MSQVTVQIYKRPRILEIIQNPVNPDAIHAVLSYLQPLPPNIKFLEVKSFFVALASHDELLDDLTSKLWDIISDPELYQYFYPNLSELKRVSFVRTI